MSQRGIILGFYHDRDAAGSVLRELRRRRFLRSAAVHHAPDGRITVRDYDVSLLHGAALGGVGGLLTGGIAVLFLLPLVAVFQLLNPWLYLIALTALGAIIGALLAWALDTGVEDALIARYKRWVVRGETLLLIQAPARDTDRVLELLRRTEGADVFTFAFFPDLGFDSEPKETLLHQTPLTTERLSLEAGRLAAMPHTVRPGHRRNHLLLRRLRDGERLLRSAHGILTTAVRVGQNVPMSAEWLLDSAYIWQGHIEEFRRNLPRRYYEELPVMADGRQAGLPRVYNIASELVADTDARLDRDTIVNFLQSYQSHAPLTTGELWAVPLMLRLRLIECLGCVALTLDRRRRERDMADFWANRLLTVARQDPEQILSFVTGLTREQPDPSPPFVDQLLEHLYDEESILTPVRGWLERKLGVSLPDVIQQERRLEALDQTSLSNAITSLRRLSQLDWRELFELVNRVDAVLWTDPADVYSRMDFATRDHYRHAVEEIARRSEATEIQVALKALEMAEDGEQTLTRHVGYYLVDEGRESLESQVGCKPSLRQRARRRALRHPTPIYLGSIALMTAGVEAVLLSLLAGAGTASGALAFFGVLALLPAGELAIQAVNFLITRLFPPRALPKMSFEHGIPDEWRTLVVVPTMLLTPGSIRQEIERLEVRSLANPDPNLRFGLLTDYCDAPQREMNEDAELLDAAVRGIEELNERYGAERFFLVHRERRWCESEGTWMGWERKRGKLEQLNRFLMGEADPELDGMLRVGDAERLRGVRFVITLDADTQLPPDTARRMVETLAHPLNRPILSADGRKIERGYVIIQPRVTTSLPSATATFFSRLFTDATGCDPYTHAVSDVYQDLAGEGSYHGKGIYDLHAFHHMLTGRFPDSHLLSHDLLEGAHVRVGHASDIELLDLFPRDYAAYSSRQHRWVRGDWQIADWLLPRVNEQVVSPRANPAGRRGREANPLSLFNRWKIFDNLRRSLVPVSSVGLLVVGWLFSPSAAVPCLFIGIVQLFPTFCLLMTRLDPRRMRDPVAWRDLAANLLRALVLTALLPHQAALSLDAVARVAYRRLISHRLLLEWETAHVTHRRSRSRQRGFLWRMSWIPVCAATLAGLAWSRAPSVGAAALAYTLLWFLSPFLVALLNTPARRQPSRALSEGDRLMLRQTARQTWRFFDDFVGPDTNWLPPDNYQAFLRVEVAQRTSPTNIGLYLLSILAAHDFGYVTLDGAVERTLETLRSLDRLERYEGHLLNWYDTHTLEPLRPRYVSMVDSGNLLASLWTLEQGFDGLLDGPVLGAAALRGLADTLALLRQVIQTGDKTIPPMARLLSALDSLCAGSSEGLMETVWLLRSAADPAEALVEGLYKNPPANEMLLYWAQQVERQVTACNTVIDRYLSWVEILASPPGDGLDALGPEAQEWRRQALAETPSLRLLTAHGVPGLQEFVELHRRGDAMNLPEPVRDWLARLAEAVSQAEWMAGERAAQAEEAISRMRALADGMNMRLMYDPKRRLFHLGFNVSDLRLDTSFYDLLSSEARLGSFVTIARGEVPVEHWAALGRLYGNCQGRRVLLSWSGTMFEYLMPLLLTRAFENSLLDEACRHAVACQIAYGRRRGIPWGITEAAFSALDARQIYQYRAFGVPGLGLRRGMEQDLVVAPYASALALVVDPAAAARNLRRLSRLARLGLRGGYGYYEAIDYTRQRGPEGQRGVIVYAYMAHHQGMTLLAIDNALNDNVMQRRFHADPRVRAAEPLLYERIPVSPPLTTGYTRPVPSPRLRAISAAPATGRVDTPHTPMPKTQLLSNGSYSLMVTNAGGGYSRWRDFEITRWRADTTRDHWGSFCYVRDVESGALWSATHHPTRVPTSFYSVTFTTEKAEFRRRDNGIEVQTEIVVSPEDNAEIRRITLTNRSVRTRQIELTSYLELALAPHETDRAHPAFSKLFVQTEALPEQGALLAWRRPRSAQDAPVWAGHVIAIGIPVEEPPQYETDRERFLGRGRGVENPAALEGDLSGSAGAVLDPIFSLRRRIALEAGQRVQVSFVTMAGETREEVVKLVEKYRDLAASRRALDLAWTHAQLELRHLRILPEEALRFQQLAAHILYPSAYLRPPAERLRQNVLGQSRLWAYGISGDLPILLVTIGDATDIDLVRQVLMAHVFWRARGLKVDVVILNEETGGYEQPLHDQLRQLIEAYSHYAGIDQPGGVFLRMATQIPEEEQTLLLAVARVALVAARGSLAQQFGAPAQAAALPPVLRRNPQAREEWSPPLPFMELPYFNSMGGFTPDGKEYAIYLGPNDRTPAPWVNVIANPSFGTLVSEAGAGFTWYGNSQSNRLTPWSNDPVSDPVGDALYIRDEDLGVFWTPTPLPIREMDAYRARHGQGYTLFEHNSHAIEQELVTFVPMDDGGGAPVRIQRLRLRNHSSRRRRLTVTSYAEWVLGTTREETQMHVVTDWDVESKSLFARNPYHSDFGGRVAFAACSPPPNSYTGDRTLFLGRNGSPSAPAALNRTRLAGRVGAALSPCAALQTAVELAPGEQTEVIFLLGQAANAAEARALAQRYRDPAQVEQALQETRAWWDNLLDAVQVETPDLAVNFLLNRWLLYQVVSCRFWGRSAFYQSGGAYGFRDQLQDVMALIYAAPELAREHILRSAARQFVEGDVQHWWHPHSGAGVRTRISDDLLWLPFATAHYVRATGDDAILDETVPFIEGRSLEEHEHEAYYIPAVSEERATLLEHCRRAIAKGLTEGPHGLPLIGGGDWNDGLNRVGIGGKGESVWLAWFLIHALNDFAELLARRGEEQNADEYRQKARHLAEAIEKEAWDGMWYRRAYFDDGTPLGSRQNKEARIDSLAQSWGVISGAADAGRVRTALRAVEKHLVREEERMILLFTPPFDKSPHDPGYIKGYLPGVRENGGQYTHGSLWVPLAFARRRNGDRAGALLRMMNPVEHARMPEEVGRYRVEPYVVAADVYALEGQVGRGGWTWYTGSAGWMYRIWLEEVFGFTLRGDTLVLDPAIPSDWSGFSLRYRYRSASYEIIVENPQHVSSGVEVVELDGQAVPEKTIALRDDGKRHAVRVRMGAKGRGKKR
jgi:cyclic beta-1,2-glucan synthetase